MISLLLLEHTWSVHPINIIEIDSRSFLIEFSTHQICCFFLEIFSIQGIMYGHRQNEKGAYENVQIKIAVPQ